jgi:hypothetical protein
MTLPYWSSVATLKVVSATPAPAVAGGATLKPSLFAAAGLTVIAALVTVPVPPADSVAVRVHDPAVSIVTALNAASPLPFTVPVVVPVRVQDDVMVIVAVDVPPVTVKLDKTVPAVDVVGGTGEKIKVSSADAAPTPTIATPARTINDAAPMPTAERNLENPNLLFITSPSSGRARLSNTPLFVFTIRSEFSERLSLPIALQSLASQPVHIKSRVNSSQIVSP